jgi:hypothetical protein
MKKKTTKLSTFAAALLGLSLHASHASASDTKWYPGQMCTHNSGLEQRDFGGVGSNAASGRIIVDCPIVRDQFDTQIDSARVTVVDRHPYENVSCFLLNPIGSANGTFTANAGPSASSTGTGYQYLPTLVSTPHQEYAASIVGCRIPPRYLGATTYITQYRVTE